MRNIGDESFLGFVRLTQAFRHVVEGLLQTIELGDIALNSDMLLEIPLGDCCRRMGQLFQGVGDLSSKVCSCQSCQ
jgi:hypothetical protein